MKKEDKKYLFYSYVGLISIVFLGLWIDKYKYFFVLDVMAWLGVVFTLLLVLFVLWRIHIDTKEIKIG